MPRKGVIPPQFLKNPPPSWKGEMRKVRSEARADIRKHGGKMPRRRSSRREYSYRTRKHNEKIGVIPAAVEITGVGSGVVEALNGNIANGAILALLGVGGGWALRKLGKHSMLHKLGIKIGRKKELTVM